MNEQHVYESEHDDYNKISHNFHMKDTFFRMKHLVNDIYSMHNASDRHHRSDRWNEIEPIANIFDHRS